MTPDAKQEPCPDAATLEQFLQANLTGPETHALEEHLLHCSNCWTIARRCREDEDIVPAMRQGPSSVSVDETVRQLMRELKNVWFSARQGHQATRDLAPGTRVGPYRLVERLGVGGMGVVYRATHTQLGRDVALKMLRDGTLDDRERLARFRQETKVIAQLRHPNIVPIYEVGEQDGHPWFAMELAEGGSLAARLAAHSLPVREVASLVRALADGIHAAHEKGVVHRDLKPANILLVSGRVVSGEWSPDTTHHSPLTTHQPKITDFGVAKQFEALGCTTHTDAILGTPNYMAPEQAAGGSARVGPATDVYALGTILYECLTGRPPFKAATVLETLEQVRSREPLPLRRLQPGVPRDLETICLKCLQKEPARRYASARELGDDLQRFLDGRPIQARPAGAVERLGKWARRRPALAALVVVCTLAVVGMVAGAAVYERRLRAALEETAAQRERAAANYRQARDTVQQMLARASARSSAGIPKLQELRRQQQEDALAFFLAMAQQQGDNPEVRFDVAQAHHQVGLLHLSLGRGEEAALDWRRAEEEFAKLVAEFPQRGLYRFHLADTLKVRGAEGRLPPAEAEDCLRRALALAEGLVGEEPSSVPFRSAEADIRITLGSFLVNQKKPKEAEEHYRRAASLYEDLRREQPEESYHPQVLAKAYLNLSVLLQQGKPSAEELAPAKEFHDKAEGLLEQLLREQPDNDDVLGSLAMLRINWAYVQMGAGQQQEALAGLARSVTMLEEALQREPKDVLLRDRLHRTHGVRGQVYEGQQHFAEAAVEFKHVVELSPDPATADFNRLFLAMNHAKAGQYPLAVEEIEDWFTRAGPTTPPEQLLHCVAVYCVALEAVRKDTQLSSSEREARTERFASRAVALLRKLQEGGYFKDPHHAEVLRADEDLHALRGRQDFQKLLAEPESGKKD
jgi:eukaryotic-like serine/threonine-protein kinase